MGKNITDKSELLRGLQSGEYGLEDASEKLKNDEDIAFVAVMKEHTEIINISPFLLNNGDFLARCVKEDFSIVRTFINYRIISFGDDAFMYKYQIAKIAMAEKKILDFCKPKFRKQVLEEIEQIKYESLSDDEKVKVNAVEMLHSFLKGKKSKDEELNALIEELRCLTDYDEIIERLASLYTFSENRKMKKKIEEYFNVMKFDINKIEEILY